MKLEKPKFIELLYLFFILLYSGIISTSFKGFFVAKDKGKVIGGISIIDYSSFYTLEYFVVIPAKRNKGFGTKILKQVLDSLSKDVFINTYRKLQKFYEKFDFIEIKEGDLPKKIRKRYKLYRFLFRFVNKEIIFMKRKMVK